MVKNFIAWDLGGTKCTAGIIEYNKLNESLVCKKYFSRKLHETSSLEDLIFQLESGLDFSMKEADAICIGAAGHYDGENLNAASIYPYAMSFAKVAQQQRWPHFQVIHDYASIVCSTFTAYMHSETNIKRLNQAKMNTYGRRVALGVGTGLGLKDGVLLENGDFWLGKNEIGHIGVTAPPVADAKLIKMHEELMHFLRRELHLAENQAITFEKILSGQGTVRLHQFFYPDRATHSPEQVGELMRAKKVPELIQAFAWYLGLFVGTVQLSFMPEGGIWLAGGVTLNHLEVFEEELFFAGINASPAYLKERQTYPLGILCHRDHALIGCGYYAARRLLT